MHVYTRDMVLQSTIGSIAQPWPCFESALSSSDQYYRLVHVDRCGRKAATAW